MPPAELPFGQSQRPGDDFRERLIAAFSAAELQGVPRPVAPLRIVGLGTVAQRVLASAAFAAAMAGKPFEAAPPCPSPSALISDDGWDLALVFSPHKQTLADLLPELTATAELTTAVDTVVRGDGRMIGFNTNAWAAQAVLEALTGGVAPTSTLILGSGPSARSVLLAARRAWGGGTDLAVTARDPRRLAPFAEARMVTPAEAGGERPTLLMNCTSWGETAESEQAPFALPFDTLLRPGLLFLDLNNRLSALQQRALEAGATVVSGVAMREAGSACRAAIPRAEANV